MNETTTKLLEVASALGGVLNIREPESSKCTSGYIKLADGVRFWFNVGGYGNEGRIRFSPAYPQHETRDGSLRTTVQRDFDREHPHGWPAFSGITVSAEKPADKIARDVERRFLPEYRPLYLKAVAWIDGEAAYHAAKRAMVQAVEHQVHGLGINRPNRSFYVDVGHVGSTEADIRIHSLSLAQVTALAAFLRTL